MHLKRALSLFCLVSALVLAAQLFTPAPAPAEDAPKITALPAPDKSGGEPLMQALSERCSTRSFTEEAVSPQDLSSLLWAAWGINRDDGRHTVPTAKNKQEVAVYVALPDGVSALTCRRCSAQRPTVCLVCGGRSTARPTTKRR